MSKCVHVRMCSMHVEGGARVRVVAGTGVGRERRRLSFCGKDRENICIRMGLQSGSRMHTAISLYMDMGGSSGLRHGREWGLEMRLG